MVTARELLGEFLMVKTFSKPFCCWRLVRAVLLPLVAVPVVVIGGLALLHLAGLHDPHPLVRFVQVDGNSMLPTFQPGEELIFVRRPWELGSVVIADIGEDRGVVKRVVSFKRGRVQITGDNRQITASYDLPANKIIATLLMPTGVRFAPPPRAKPHVVHAQGTDGAHEIPTP